MFYYIYQSFLIHPPIGSGLALDEIPVEEVKIEQPPPARNPGRAQPQSAQDEEKSFQQIILTSKVEDKINNYY